MKTALFLASVLYLNLANVEGAASVSFPTRYLNLIVVTSPEATDPGKIFLFTCSCPNYHNS